MSSFPTKALIPAESIHLAICPDTAEFTHSSLLAITMAFAETGCYDDDYYLNQNWYGGKVSVTQTGVTCQGWGVDVPHQRHNVVVAELLSM